MTSRILPPSEYDRLADTYLAPLADALPNGTQVVVVEDDGAIVAHWALMMLPHVECAWVHPLYRKHPGVVRRLYVGMLKAARDWGVSRVMTAAMDDEVRGLLAHLGAERLPGEHYVWPMPHKETSCP